jgi:hypothetical protein
MKGVLVIFFLPLIVQTKLRDKISRLAKRYGMEGELLW